MSLTVSKVRGANNLVQFSFQDGQKNVSWRVDSDDDDAIIIGVLQDIVNVVHPSVDPWDVPGGNNTHFVADMQRVWSETVTGHNAGAEAADKAARAEEQRLMNMGSALAKGINLGPEDIPVFDNGDLPPVNWSN